MQRYLSASMALAALFITTLTTSFPQSARAAGLEKSVFWSGRYAPLAGVAQSSVSGPESTYWNPAGLGGAQGLQLNANFSPTLSKFSGPFGRNPTPQDSSLGLTPVAAAFASYGVTPELGVGLGAYVSAANKSQYDAVDLGLQSVLGTTYNPPFRGDVSVIEASLGAGYEITPGLRAGAAWRVLFASANLGIASVSGSNLLSIRAENLSQTLWNGFRAGVEWNPKDSAYGLGITWRNPVSFELTGDGSVTLANAAAPAGNTIVSGQKVTASSRLPMRLDFAGHYRFLPSWTGFLGYSFTQYSDNDNIPITGFPTAVIPGGQVNLPLGWNNMQNARAALAFDASDSWIIRGGYVFTTQVTPKSFASPILPSPGTGHTVAAGAGYHASRQLEVDGGLEYSWDTGSVAASDIPSGSNTAAGDFWARAFVVHVGANYSF